MNRKEETERNIRRGELGDLRASGHKMRFLYSQGEKSLSFLYCTVYTLLYTILPLKHKSVAIARFIKDHIGFLHGIIDES